MRSTLLQPTLILLTSIVFAASPVSGQDLGSSNKLFGGKPQATRKPTTQKKSAKKPSKIKASAAKSKSSNKVSTRKPSRVTKSIANSNKAVIAPRNLDTTPAVVTGKATANSAAVDAQFEQLIELGNTARSKRDHIAAESAYSEAKMLKPKDARSFLGLGNIYADQHRWDDAEKSYRSSIDLDPDEASSLLALSFVLSRPVSAPDLSERYDEAERLARRVLKAEPKNSFANDQLGVALELRGEIGTETESAYRRSIQFDPGFAPAYAHLGRLLRKKGKTEESAAAYRDAMTRSSDTTMRILVAEVLQSEGRINEAIQLLDIALGSDQRNSVALAMLGQALTTVGNYSDAERTLKKSIEVSPSGFAAYSFLGSLYVRQGKFEAAENVLVQSTRFVTALEKRRLATQFEAVGDGYAKAGKSSNATRAYRKAIEIDPDRETLNGKINKLK